MALAVYHRPVVLNDEIGQRLEEELLLHPDGAEPPVQPLLSAELEDEPTDETPRAPADPQPQADPEPQVDPVVALLTEIRDLLKGPGQSGAELEVKFLRASEEHARQRAQDEHALAQEKLARHKTLRQCFEAWVMDQRIREHVVKAFLTGWVGGGAGATATAGAYLGVQGVELLWHLWGGDLLRLLGIL